MIQHVIVAVLAAVVQLAIMFLFKSGSRTSIKAIDEYSVEQAKNPFKEAIQAFLPALVGSIGGAIVAPMVLGSSE